MKKISYLFLSFVIIAIGVMAWLPMENRADTKGITVPFLDAFTDRTFEWEFPFDEEYFREPAEEFSPDLAKASLGLTLSAFRNTERGMDNQYETYLKGAGFENIFAFGYDQPTSKDTISGVIAHRQVDDFILIAAVPCGQGYGKEWAGNLEVGNEERHVGFNHAARIMEEQIRAYIETNQLNGKLKLWMGGFSRAAAVANLTAADMIQSGLFEDVYAYLFAVPRTTKDPDCFQYSGIYNICGKNDPVTQIPMQAWGFERYGKDLYTPSMEGDSEYYSLMYEADQISEQLLDDMLWYNPEVSYQVHLIIEFLTELFPTNKEYTEVFQDTLMEFWNEANPDAIGNILTQALMQLENMDARQEYSTDILIDYLTYITAMHLRESSEQVERGFWNPEQKISENIFREHMPVTYLSWVFSDNTIDSLYYGPGETRRLYFHGNMDVEVFRNGTSLLGLTKNGEYYLPEPIDIEEENLFRSVLLIRNGSETMVCIPFDGDYQVRLLLDKPETLTFYDVFNSPSQTFGELDMLYHMRAEIGVYELDFSENQEDFTVRGMNEEPFSLIEVPYQYSPTMIMAGESSAVEHITISGLFLLIFYVIVFVLLLLLVCLIIFIIHAIRRRKRGKPYSPWFVIVPHLIVIVLFVLLTQFFTVNMFSIGMTRTLCAGITMATVFLLALRGLIRNRNWKNLLILAAALAILILNVLIYQKSALVSASLLHFILYSVCMAGISILAVRAFYTKKKV